MLQSGHGMRDGRTDVQTYGRTEWNQYTSQQLRCIITPGNFLMIWWEQNFEKDVTGGRTEGCTDGRTDRSVLRAAWSQLTIPVHIYDGSNGFQGNCNIGGAHKTFTNQCTQLLVQFSSLILLHSPRTANISVFVKCLYNDSFTRFLRNLKVRVVCTRLVKMWAELRKNHKHRKQVDQLQEFPTYSFCKLPETYRPAKTVPKTSDEVNWSCSYKSYSRPDRWRIFYSHLYFLSERRGRMKARILPGL